MNDRLEVVLPENIVEGGKVCDVAFVKLGQDTSDLLDTLERFRRGIDEIVDDDDFLASIDELDDGVRADVTCSTGYKDRMWSAAVRVVVCVAIGV